MLSSRCLHLITDSAEKMHVYRLSSQWVFSSSLPGCLFPSNCPLSISALWTFILRFFTTNSHFLLGSVPNSVWCYLLLPINFSYWQSMGKTTLLVFGCSGFIQRNFILVQPNAKGWIYWAELKSETEFSWK